MNEKNGPMERVVESLYATSSEMTVEELKEDLKAHGIDPDDLIANVRGLVEAQKKADRLAWQQEADAKRARLIEARRSTGSWRVKSDDEIRAAFKARTASGEVALSYRNIDSLTVDDMAKLLDNMDRVQ